GDWFGLCHLPTSVPLDQPPSRGEEFVVLHVPDGPVAVAARGLGQVGDQLAHPPVGKEGSQLLHCRQQVVARHCRHGTKSPTFGYEPAGIGRSSMTSTRTSVPGNSFAIRVARVTPLLMTNSPSD